MLWAMVQPTINGWQSTEERAPAEERAREWVSVNSEATVVQQYAALVDLLKEERKIARYDCAEALAGVFKSIDESNRAVVAYDEAHEAVMNARAT